MHRRKFIKTSSVFALGLPLINGLACEDSRAASAPSITARWIIHEDGSFSLMAGTISLDHCYPACDGKPLFAKSVKVAKTPDGGTIVYQVQGGEITLTLASSGDSLVLSSSINLPEAPHYFYPLGFAEVAGADRYVKQGIGFAGPSGVFDLPKPPVSRESPVRDEAWSVDSYLVSGFLSESGDALAIGAYQHDQFLQRSTYYNRTHRFGLIDRHLNTNRVLFESGFGTEKITLTAPLKLPDLHFIVGSQPFGVFKSFAEQLARTHSIKLKPPRYQWCSWYEFEDDYTQARLDAQISGLKKLHPPLPLQALQIDAGFAVAGDWLVPVKQRYPDGIPHIAQSILSAGYEAGIWVGPFRVSDKSQLFRDHPDWLVKDIAGNIYAASSNPNGKTCVLDTSHPEAFAYLRTVFRELKKMGFTYFKTDFLDWGLLDRTEYQRHDNSKTSVQHFMEVVRMIREEIGPDSFWLACIAPFPPMIGYADAVRFSNDIPATAWIDGSHGNLIREGVARHIFQHVLWQNDPDTVFLRDVDSKLNAGLTKDEVYTIALFDGMLGGFVTTSDRFHKITPEYLRLYRFLQPAKQPMTCRFPYWGGRKRHTTAVRDYAGAATWAVLVTNALDREITETHQVRELIGHDHAWCYDWLPGTNSSLGEKTALEVTLKPHQSKLFYLSLTDAAPADNLGLFGITINY